MSELLTIEDFSYKLPITNSVFVIVIVGYAVPFLFSSSSVEKYILCESDLTSLMIPSLGWINFILSRIVFLDFKNYFFSLVLITIFRSFERMYGSKKFANYMFANLCTSTFLELVIINILNHFEIVNIAYLANGGGIYSYIFALFINYCKDIPKEKFDFFGISFSEKLLIYFFGIQMLFTSYSVLVASICGLVGGLMSRSNAFNVCDIFHLPHRLLNIVIKILNTILLSSNTPIESIYNGATHSDRRQQYQDIYEQNLLNDQLNFLNQTSSTHMSAAASSSSASSSSSSSQFTNINEEELEKNINQLKAMGFDLEKAKQTLKNTNNDLSRATHLLLDDNR